MDLVLVLCLLKRPSNQRVVLRDPLLVRRFSRPGNQPMRTSREESSRSSLIKAVGHIEGQCSPRVEAEIFVGHSRNLLSGVFPFLLVYGLYQISPQDLRKPVLEFIDEFTTYAGRRSRGV